MFGIRNNQYFCTVFVRCLFKGLIDRIRGVLETIHHNGENYWLHKVPIYDRQGL